MCPPTTIIISAPQLGRCVAHPMHRHVRRPSESDPLPGPGYDSVHAAAARAFRLPAATFELHLLSEYTGHCDFWTPTSAPLDPAMGADAWAAVLEKLVAGDGLVAWFPMWAGRWPRRGEVMALRARIAVRRGVGWVWGLVLWLWVVVLRLVVRRRYERVPLEMAEEGRWGPGGKA